MVKKSTSANSKSTLTFPTACAASLWKITFGFYYFTALTIEGISVTVPISLFAHIKLTNDVFVFIAERTAEGVTTASFKYVHSIRFFYSKSFNTNETAGCSNLDEITWGFPTS